ncbi:hypothetical protein KI809_14835 [Geobacter pelophilus]|uniref:Uncharacterized protein n=1 Tax=Geoanaerobacter pelophilus TaxID=60036 RepID=A0AAW4L5Y1_9BACT|nr:hypothetical protein [Geoanaerobacter pelophilus]MBT0665582.1 hypothetical protein [Geoanaerobacter pelophilus]
MTVEQESTLRTLLAAISGFFICLALLIAVLNMSIMAGNRRKRGESGDRPASFIPILSLLFAGAAYYTGKSVLGFWPLAATLADPATWSIISLPFYLLSKAVQRKEG